MRFRFLAPAGSPLAAQPVLRALGHTFALARGAGPDLTPIMAALGVRHGFPLNSGRSALCLALRSLRQLRPERDLVALPAYTCFSVAASVVRAGLKVYPLEMDPQTLDFDYTRLEQLPTQRLLCLVTSNLFGFVNDLPRILAFARAAGAFVVDDAAQALGASRQGRPAGTLGDVGIFSLGRGKALAAVHGGLVVTDSDEIAELLRKQAAALPRPSLLRAARFLIELLGYWGFLRPSLYWIPNALPFLRLGVTEYNPDFTVERMQTLAQVLLCELFDNLPELNRARLRNAQSLETLLRGLQHFSLISPPPGTLPTYVRFPLLAKDRATRDCAVRVLCAAGIGASAFYPSAICDIPDLRPHLAAAAPHCPKAEELAETLLTVPVHPFVASADLTRMARLLASMQPEEVSAERSMVGAGAA